MKALYPSVPRSEAREAVKAALEEREDTTVPTDAFLELMDLVLNNNLFEFNGKRYIQREGTAIGSRLGKNYACTYLGSWENQLHMKSTKQPTFYGRYIDDIFGIWEHSKEDLENYVALANSIHEKIQLTLRWSKSSIEFLDVLLKIGPKN